MSDARIDDATAPPYVYVSTVALAATGTDIKLAFSDTEPTPDKNGDIGGGEPRRVGRVVLAMSFHTAKDLRAVIDQAISQLEKDFGTLDTPFLQEQKKNKRVPQGSG